jgi:DNA-binding beta-propeller fold protein YncE
VFVSDDLAAWLVGLLADAGRKKLTTLVLGSEQERALRSAAGAAVQRTAEELRPGDDERAEQLAMVVSQVFGEQMPSAPIAGDTTVLEALQAGIAVRLAVLDDASLTGTGQPSADVLGVTGAVVAAKLTGHMVREIMVRGSRGGPLEPLASQLNHDKTHLQGQRIEDILGRLDNEVRKALTRLDTGRPGEVVSRPGKVAGHVFISYVREDSHRVDHLQRTLQAAGIPVWRDTADLWPGEDWRAKIRHAITDNALVFIACFSSASLARYRSYQNEELTLAIEQMRLRNPDDSWFVPVRFDECEIPDRDIGGGRTLMSIQRADLFGDRSEDGTARLVAAILRILGGHPDSEAADGDRASETAATAQPEPPSEPTTAAGSGRHQGPVTTASAADTALLVPETVPAPAVGQAMPRLDAGPAPGQRHWRRPIVAIVVVTAVFLSALGAGLALSLNPGSSPFAVDICARGMSGPANPAKIGSITTGRAKNDFVGVAFSPDCHILATEGDGTVRVMNLVTGQLITTMHAAPGSNSLGLAFTPDGKILAAASADGPTTLWDAATGHRIATLNSDPVGTWSVAFSPDGKELFTEGSAGVIDQWDVSTHQRITKIITGVAVGSMALSPNGQLLAVGGNDGNDRLYNMATYKLIGTLRSGEGHVFAMAFSPNNATLVTGTLKSAVQWWDAATGKLITHGVGNGSITDVAFSPDGRILAAGSEGIVQLWNTETRQLITTLHIGSNGWPQGLRFSRYGGILAVGWRGTLQFWNVGGITRRAA